VVDDQGPQSAGHDAGDASATAHFERKRPGWFTAHVFNPLVAGLTRMGISLFGSRVLEVKGRSSGVPRRTPVNVLTLDGARYLVAPRGDTQWARNLRASGEGRLLVGPRSEHFTATELSDEEKAPVLRAYLKRWKFEVGVFFDGLGPDSSEEEMRAAAPKHPAFRLQ
jgi:deazaflavin-dependent oxidoreductase (nitroreductase family)